MSSIDEYRTAVFLRTMLIPQIRRLGYVDPEAMEQVTQALIGNDSDLLESASATPGQGIGAILLFEALGWLESGKKGGYFIDEASQLLRDRLNENSIGFDSYWFQQVMTLDERYGPHLATSQLDSWHPSDSEFSDALIESYQSLTPEHTEFLQLTYLASDNEWKQRIENVGEFVQTLESTPDLSLGDAVVDHLGWALNGSEPSGIAQTPSRWRFEWALSAFEQREEIALGGPIRGRIRQRISTLAYLHDRIAVAALTLTTDPTVASATRLRRSLDRISEGPEGIAYPGFGLPRQYRMQLYNESPLREREPGQTLPESIYQWYRQAGGS